jgi:hypothetical protein
MLPVTQHPFLESVFRFRAAHGYPGTLFAEPQRAAAGLNRAVSPGERLAEVIALLEAPDCPRPRRAFEAYCLGFQLVVAVDNRYFGPFHPGPPALPRLGLPGAEGLSELQPSPRRVLVPFNDLALVLSADGALEIRPSVEIDRSARFQHWRSYVESALAGQPGLAPAATKRERMARFVELLADAPAPADDLAAMATVNGLLGALEWRHFRSVPRGAAPGGQLNGVLPFNVFASPALAGAAILFSIAHMLVYYPDGTLEIHERDPAADLRRANRLLAVRLERRVARLRGAAREPAFLD